jgi:hypothetical protein
MMRNTVTPERRTEQHAPAKPLKPYVKLQLVVWGTMAELTRGGGGATFDVPTGLFTKSV